MPKILLVADRQSVIDRVHTALVAPEIGIIEHTDPETAAEAAYSGEVDTVLVDMRVGSMGAMAVTRSVREKAAGGVAIPVAILLDREVDAFLAKRAGAAAWVLSDASADQIRAAVTLATAPSE